MHDEMFGHLLAAMRFGADEGACRAAIEIAFRYAVTGHFAKDATGITIVTSNRGHLY